MLKHRGLSKWLIDLGANFWVSWIDRNQVHLFHHRNHHLSLIDGNGSKEFQYRHRRRPHHQGQEQEQEQRLLLTTTIDTQYTLLQNSKRNN